MYCIYIYVYMSIYSYHCIYIYIYIYIYLYINIYMYIYTHPHTHTYTYVCNILGVEAFLAFSQHGHVQHWQAPPEERERKREIEGEGGDL